MTMNLVLVAYDIPHDGNVQDLALLGVKFHEPVSLPLLFGHDLHAIK
jgi:hypothetical protein